MNKIRINKKLLVSLDAVLLMKVTDIRELSNIPRTSWYTLMSSPGDVTIKQLLGLANGLSIPVRKFFSTDQTDVIGKRDDYVVSPYVACYYDSDALNDIISRRADATWQKAAKAIGMARDNLRRSLLAIRRTPVERFLSVCSALSIDPFSILVDPNHPSSSRNRSKPFAKVSDISELRNQLADISAAVEELRSKYEMLLKAHEQLAQRVQVNIETINSSYIHNIGMAAEVCP